MKRELSFRQKAIIEMPYPLLELLIKHKCLSQFADNCRSIYHEPNSNSSACFLLLAFVWDITPEGHEFWNNLYYKLREKEGNRTYIIRDQYYENKTID